MLRVCVCVCERVIFTSKSFMYEIKGICRTVICEMRMWCNYHNISCAFAAPAHTHWGMALYIVLYYISDAPPSHLIISSLSHSTISLYQSFVVKRFNCITKSVPSLKHLRHPLSISKLALSLHTCKDHHIRIIFHLSQLLYPSCTLYPSTRVIHVGTVRASL